MFDPIGPPQATVPLRQQAEQQISTGTAPLSTDFTASADALGVLYRLSSTANTASDGLKLLHELQIHQVELDLQLEQLQNNERESEHELGCYQQFFAMAPVGCLILSVAGIITDCNTAATRLFGPDTEHGQAERHAKYLCGRSVQSLFCATCGPMLSATLARVQRNQQSATLIVTTAPDSAGPRNVQLTINLSPDKKALLIMLTDDAAYLSAAPPATEQL